jgi:hypothetical protein
MKEMVNLNPSIGHGKNCAPRRCGGLGMLVAFEAAAASPPLHPHGHFNPGISGFDDLLK